MKGQTCATKIELNNQIFVKKSDIADQFNQCFVNVGPKLARAISDGHDNPLKYIKTHLLQVLFFLRLLKGRSAIYFLILVSAKPHCTFQIN